MGRISVLEEETLIRVVEITNSCGIEMEKNGIFQWNSTYPNIDVLSKDIDRGELFGYYLKEDLIAIMVLTDIMDDEYLEVDWLTANGNNLYVHRLAVDPAHQNKGVASKMMDFAEEYGRQKGYDSIRLDTFSKNSKNNNFYLKRSYKKLSDVYFPKQSEHPFHCYELLLNG
jgi:ribosomal protein S18 acetylase RimI-like enzyme